MPNICGSPDCWPARSASHGAASHKYETDPATQRQGAGAAARFTGCHGCGQRAGRLHLFGKGEAATSEMEAELALHVRTTARYNGGSWHIKHERATPTEGLRLPAAARCLHPTGNLVSNYAVTVTISMPDVPSGLSPCQLRRVREVPT